MTSSQIPAPSTAGDQAARPPRLTRRRPGATLPPDFVPENGPTRTGVDAHLLKRLHTALVNLPG